MTDEEINRRVAEIEGWYSISKTTWAERDGKGVRKNGPPLYATDWQWCGPLVERNKIKVWFDGDDWAAQIEEFNALEWADTPQRAICLAVVSAQPTPATLPPEAPIHDNDRS